MKRITERHQNHTQNLAPLLQTLCLGLFVTLLVGSWPQLTMAQKASSVTQVTESLTTDPIIISVTAPPALSTLIVSPFVVSTSWSQSKPYTGVSIAALVDSAIVGQTPTADAYLTTRIGPGTTVMDEIAHTRFTVPAELPVCSPASCGAMVTLFSGLSLGPGEYFVTMSPATISSGAVGWFPALNPTVLVDTGVSEGASFIAHAVAPYPPASAFGVYPFAMNFTVTGTAAFAGTPRRANCHGKSVSALARQHGGLDAAAAALGFPSVQTLQDAIREFCEE
jgi:hypothetical protein